MLYGKRTWARKLQKKKKKKKGCTVLVDGLLIANSLSILWFAGIIAFHICYIHHSLKGTNSGLGMAISESLTLLHLISSKTPSCNSGKSH